MPSVPPPHHTSGRLPSRPFHNGPERPRPCRHYADRHLVRLSVTPSVTWQLTVTPTVTWCGSASRRASPGATYRHAKRHPRAIDVTVGVTAALTQDRRRPSCAAQPRGVLVPRARSAAAG